MPSYYPMFVDLQGKRCLVVGGGEIATRKVQGLLDADALVVVVSPALCEALATLAAQGVITYQSRPFRADDVLGCTLVIGATDQLEVNMAVCKAARAHDVWVNIVDTPEACDFIAPAIVRRGALQIAISTGGAQPDAGQTDSHATRRGLWPRIRQTAGEAWQRASAHPPLDSRS